MKLLAIKAARGKKGTPPQRSKRPLKARHQKELKPSLGEILENTPLRFRELIEAVMAELL
jgi:hypothetical protein